jgi:hypothetical protein
MFIATGMSASSAAPQQPELFDKLLACRSVRDASARLACFDERVAAMDAAAKRADLVVVDRGDIHKARKSLFGLTLPALGIFGGGERERREAESFTEIESTIRSARSNGYRWTVILEDGARWVQVDSKMPPRDPKPGQTIRIRKAALGSFLANIGGQRAIRMRREN